MRKLLLGFAALLLATVSSLAQQQPSPLPAGGGRDAVAVACTQCHGPAVIANLRQGEQAWRAQVNEMILRGAQIMPGETDAVVDYLFTHFGPGINVPPGVVNVTLPDRPGKEIVESSCSVCHGLDRVVLGKRKPAEWDAIVKRMIFLGAPIAESDVRQLTTYLNQNIGVE